MMTSDYEHTVVLPASENNSSVAQGTIFFIGTATLLIRYAGFTILTDPNFLRLGERAHVGFRQSASRITNPAIGFDALPSLDFVLLSHLHEDHFDAVVTRKLMKNVPIVTTPQAAKALTKKHFQVVHALKTWQVLTIVKDNVQLRITAMPAKHASGVLGAAFPAVMGSMLEFQTLDRKDVYRLYISGDTVLHKQMKQIPKRFSNIDMAFIHLGGEKVYGIKSTMDGKQGVELLKLINARETVPIHYNDYHFYTSSLEDFRSALSKTRLEKRVRYLGRGDLHTFQIPLVRL